MNILVTGGCGFVGRHLIHQLLKRKNTKITCVDPLLKFTGAIDPKKWPFVKPLNFSNFIEQLDGLYL